MTRGRHVTEEECTEIRRLKARGVWDEIIAEKVDVHRTAVYYHVAGKCDHSPPPDGLLDDCPED
jgi:hypothetical protein